MLPQALHLHLFADSLQTWLPTGLAGFIGMIRNWMFTLFYVSSELWGDIVLSLLFWGLANETTSLYEASLLYPLFGVGANVGQVGGGGACLGRRPRGAGGGAAPSQCVLFVLGQVALKLS